MNPRGRPEDSVFNEPQHTGSFKREVRNSAAPGEDLADPVSTESLEPGHSVFDEPSTPRDQHGPGYADWLAQRRAAVGPLISLAVCALLAVVSGLLAVLATLIAGDPASGGVLLLVLFGPMIEEVMKLAAPSYIVEAHPYLFRARWQIIFVAAGSGLGFSAVENLLYIHVYIKDPSPEIIAWRWSVCVAMHVACSIVASLGLARAWSHAMRHHLKPDITRGVSLLITAIVIHGTYNAFAIALQFTLGTF